jgi:predicted DCC family thiol-disulfide oxidoreductase YuxK
MGVMVESESKRLVVYTDGGCPFCLWSRRKVEGYDREHLVEFRDYNDPVLARETPYADSELGAEMHVLAPGGRWYGGFFAWLEILKVLPRWRWLGELLGCVPFRWMGPPLYRLIARNRYGWPNFVLRRIGAPPPCPPQGSCSAPKVS